MNDRHCLGCGAKIQSTEPDSFGFVPTHLLDRDELLCQRCFRINNYGRDELGPVAASDALTSISAGVEWATGVCLVVDLLDFEAGFPSELLGMLRGKDFVLAVNKVDLIPKQTPLPELQRWVRARLKHYGLPQGKIILVSAANGHGFPELADLITDLGKQVLFAGVTNVGKSSLVQRLLKMRIGGRRRKSIEPTISSYPGTTVSVSRWTCPDGLILADSPGYVPQGRISDLVSPELAQQIIPHKSLSSHLYPVQPHDIIFIKGLCAVECITTGGGGLLLGFTGSGASWQKSTTKQLCKSLEKDSEFAEITNWQEHPIRLKPGEDLSIDGLGWISARRSHYKLGLHLPAGVEFTVRPNLIGQKNKK